MKCMEKEQTSQKKLDETDHQILKLLCQNARLSLKDIAAKVYLSSPTVAARIRRMEKAGIIEGYQPRLNYALLSYAFKAFINLEVAPEDRDRFVSFIRKQPEIVECSWVTGDYSMLMEGVFLSSEDLDHLISQLQQFGRTKTQIVFSTSVKYRTALSDQ